MYAEVDICNFAISNLGVDSPIANLNEDSTEARACNRYYKVAKNSTLRDFPWPFNVDIPHLEQVVTFSETNRGYGYRFGYRYPPNALHVFMLLDDSFDPRRGGVPTAYSDYDAYFLNRTRRIPYKLFRGESGKLIHTDADNARALIGLKDTPTEEFDDDFVLALSFKLSALIAPFIARGEKDKADRMEARYQYLMDKAMAAAVNEEEPEPEQESDFVMSRV